MTKEQFLGNESIQKMEEVEEVEEDLQHCLNSLDYYTYDVEIEKVTRYEFNK